MNTLYLVLHIYLAILGIYKVFSIHSLICDAKNSALRTKYIACSICGSKYQSCSESHETHFGFEFFGNQDEFLGHLCQQFYCSQCVPNKILLGVMSRI